MTTKIEYSPQDVSSRIDGIRKHLTKMTDKLEAVREKSKSDYGNCYKKPPKKTEEPEEKVVKKKRKTKKQVHKNTNDDDADLKRVSGHWSTRTDFLFVCFAYVIGLENIGVFAISYVKYGVMFLVPYLLFIILFGTPVVILEFTLGQFTSRGFMACWEFAKIIRGLSYAMLSVVLLTGLYSSARLATSLLFLGPSTLAFINETPLPFYSCDQPYNTPYCRTPSMIQNSTGVDFCKNVTNIISQENGTCQTQPMIRNTTGVDFCKKVTELISNLDGTCQSTSMKTNTNGDDYCKNVTDIISYINGTCQTTSMFTNATSVDFCKNVTHIISYINGTCQTPSTITKATNIDSCKNINDIISYINGTCQTPSMIINATSVEFCKNVTDLISFMNGKCQTPSMVTNTTNVDYCKNVIDVISYINGTCQTLSMVTNATGVELCKNVTDIISYINGTCQTPSVKIKTTEFDYCKNMTDIISYINGTCQTPSMITNTTAVDQCKNVTEIVSYENGTCYNTTSGRLHGIWNDTIAESHGIKWNLSVVEYLHYSVYQKKDGGLMAVGGLKWEVCVSYLIVWVFIVLIMSRGLKTASKVMYITALLPVAWIVVILVYMFRGPVDIHSLLGLFLHYDMSVLTNSRAWIEAAGVVSSSLGVGQGIYIALASHNRLHCDIVRDAVTVVVVSIIVNVTGAMLICSCFASMAEKQIYFTPSSVSELLFVILPEGVRTVSPTVWWLILFYVVVFVAGLDTVVIYMEEMASSICDVMPHLRAHPFPFRLVLCTLCFLAGLILCMGGGDYITQLLIFYTGVWNTLLLIFFQVVGVAYIYGATSLLNDLEFMVGHRGCGCFPLGGCKWYWVIALRFIIPACLLGMAVLGVVKFEGLTNGTYKYPLWADLIGLLIVLSTVIFVLAGAIHTLSKSSGSFYERLRSSFNPSVYWGPALPSHRRLATHLPNMIVDPWKDENKRRKQLSLIVPVDLLEYQPYRPQRY